MTGVYVFLGPSLAHADAAAILSAEYLPPVRMGDVQALVPSRPRVICIIDGYFERVPAVWHKEILHALAQGIRVVGASSMGALRAAELHTFGMEGVGDVFEAFRDGALTADDEVALSHAAAADGYRPLSEPLVNLRDGLTQATSHEILTQKERDALVERARATFYPERSWPRVFSDAAEIGVAASSIERLRAFVEGERPNAKRRDAIAALKYVGDTLDWSMPRPPFDFEPTEFWHRLVGTTARAFRAGPVSAQVLDHARLSVDDYRALRLGALLSLLASAEGARAGLRVAPEQVSAAAERFRMRSGLHSAERMRTWLTENALTPEDFTELCRLDVVCDELAARYGHTLEGAIAAELKRAGRWSEVSRGAEARATRLAERGMSSPSLEDARTDARGLLAWYAERFRPLAGGLDAHAKDRGFGDTSSFLREVVRAYYAEKAEPRGA